MVGYTQANSDQCLYYIHSPQGITFVAISRDEFLVTAPSKKDPDHFESTVKSNYELKNLRTSKLYLGWKVYINNNGDAHISQPSPIDPTSQKNVLKISTQNLLHSRLDRTLMRAVHIHSYPWSKTSIPTAPRWTQISSGFHATRHIFRHNQTRCVYTLAKRAILQSSETYYKKSHENQITRNTRLWVKQQHHSPQLHRSRFCILRVQALVQWTCPHSLRCTHRLVIM